MGFCKKTGLFVAGTFLVLILFFYVLQLPASFDLRYLRAILNTIFIGGIQLFVAFHTAKAYLNNNFQGALPMACGLFVFGVSAILAGWLYYARGGANAAVTIHICGYFVFAILQLASSITDRMRSNTDRAKRVRLLKRTCAGVALYFALLLGLLYGGILPPFVIENGYTVERQVIAWIAIVNLTYSSIAYYTLYKRKQIESLYWYFLFLLMTTIGLLGICAGTHIGSIVVWIGRCAQYAGGVYAYMFVLAANLLAREQSLSIADVLADFFVNAEETYRSVAEASPNAIFSFDEEYRILIMNSTAERILGYSFSDVRSKSFLNLFLPPRYHALFREKVRNFVLGGEQERTAIPFEIEAVCKDGSRIPVEVSFTIRKLSAAQVCTCILHNISDRKQSEKTVQRQNSILRAINRMHESAVSCATPDELIEICLDEAEAIAGASLGFLGIIETARQLQKTSDNNSSVQFYMRNRAACTKVENRDAINGLHGIFIRCGRSRIFNDIANRMEMFNIPEGHPPIQSLLGVPYRQKGGIIGLAGAANRQGGFRKEDQENLEALAPVIFEVLAHKKHEAAQRESEYLLRAIISSLPEQVFLMDKNNTLVVCNAACERLSHKPVEELIGTDAQNLYRDEQAAAAARQSETRAIKEHRTIVSELVTAEQKIYTSTRMPWLDTEGNVLGVIGTMHDITERIRMVNEIKRKAAELEQKNSTLTEFFTNISHELKTPLAIILIQLELMRTLEHERKMQRYIENTTQNALRLTRLVSNILDIACIDSGHIKPCLVDTDIIPLIADIRKSVEPYATANSLQLNLRTPLVTKTMPVDIEKLERILLNLLSNAIKHTGEGGRITLSVRETHGGGVSISVKDTGEGIPLSKQPLIFNRFAQVDSSLSRTAEGSGIGLSLTKSLVEMLGGTICVRSREGFGSEFIVELPLLKADASQLRMNSIGFDLSRKTAMELSDIYVKQQAEDDQLESKLSS